MQRRDFNSLVLSSMLIAEVLSRKALAQPSNSTSTTPAATQPGDMPLHVLAFVHNDIVMMDLIAPMTVFNLMGARIDFVAATEAPVRTDLGMPVVPTFSIQNAPISCDILFVPGGLEAMDHRQSLDYLAAVGAQSRYVTSVCTGSLLLGAAGLLRGFKATSHWYVRDLLGLFGAESTYSRVVMDGNRITGGGVTAGMDFGLSVAAQLRGEQVAKTIQLVLEYDPEPAFQAGTPETAGAELTQSVLQRRSPLIEAAREKATRIGKAWI